MEKFTNTIFFPSCKAKAEFKQESLKLMEYLEKKYKVKTTGCCRINCQKLLPEQTAVVVCNNCAAILEESSDTEHIRFAWELIDEDKDFVFPDYHGEAITVQDCWIAVEKRRFQETVRSLLKKMNFTLVELEENYDRTRFCGVNLLSPCTKSNAELAHRRYVEEGSHMFRPMSAEEQEAYFKQHCRQIKTKRVASYCKYCRDGINLGGKEGLHLLQLLFPDCGNA